MTKYYFLATALPALQIGVPPEIDFQELVNLLKDNLTSSDAEKVKWIRRVYDLQNIRNFWKNEPFEHWGNLDPNELEEALLTREGDLPKYVFDFLEQYGTLEERLQYFPELLTQYFELMEKKTSGFLRSYAQFELNLRLALTAFRARQLGRDLTKELQFQDPEKDIIVQLLAQKTAKVFEPPAGFDDLKPLLEKHYHTPYDLFKALVEYRFSKYETFVGMDVFSMDYILLYLVEYILVDRWMRLDKEQGLEIVDSIVKDIV